MYVTISKSGSKAGVIKQLRDVSEANGASKLEAATAHAIAHHIHDNAVDGTVSVSASLSLSYSQVAPVADEPQSVASQVESADPAPSAE